MVECGTVTSHLCLINAHWNIGLVISSFLVRGQIRPLYAHKMRHFLDLANKKAALVFDDQSEVWRALITGSWISRGGICKSALPPAPVRWISCYFLFKVNTSKRFAAQIESCMRDLSLSAENSLIRLGPGWINDAANILKSNLLASSLMQCMFDLIMDEIHK